MLQGLKYILSFSSALLNTSEYGIRIDSETIRVIRDYACIARKVHSSSSYVTVRAVSIAGPCWTQLVSKDHIGGNPCISVRPT